MSSVRMPGEPFLDDEEDAAGNVAVLYLQIVGGCCLCARDNGKIFLKKLKDKENVSAAFQGFLMLTGFGLGLWATIQATPTVYKAVAEWMSDNPEEIPDVVKIFAGLTNIIVAIYPPIIGVNLGGWAARGLEKAWMTIFRPEVSLPVVNPEPIPRTKYGTL